MSASKKSRYNTMDH